MDAIEKLQLKLTQIEVDHLLIALGSTASLDRSPKKNYVEENGGLPPYVRELANALVKKGFTISHAIATALSRLKYLAAHGEPDTKAKAVEALAQYAALLARTHAKSAAKKA